MLRALGCLVLAFAPAVGVAGTNQQPLLHLSQGQLPTDTASDGRARFTLEPSSKLGGSARKIRFADADSVGDRVVRITDWKPFIALEFPAFGPSREKINLTFTVRHQRTTSYQTRVDMPVVLNPGRNEVRIGIDEMLNVNGSMPDLAHVVRWYLACGAGSTPTNYLGDIWLVGGVAPAGMPPSTMARPSAATEQAACSRFNSAAHTT